MFIDVINLINWSHTS